MYLREDYYETSKTKMAAKSAFIFKKYSACVILVCRSSGLA